MRWEQLDGLLSHFFYSHIEKNKSYNNKYKEKIWDQLDGLLSHFFIHI